MGLGRARQEPIEWTNGPPDRDLDSEGRSAAGANAADGADGIFERPTYPDDPAAGTAFPTERNVDAQHPEESHGGGGQ
jgi:hypothetical protein